MELGPGLGVGPGLGLVEVVAFGLKVAAGGLGLGLVEFAEVVADALALVAGPGPSLMEVGLVEVSLDPVLVELGPSLGLSLSLGLVEVIAGGLKVAAGGLGLGLVVVADVVADALALVASLGPGLVEVAADGLSLGTGLGVGLGLSLVEVATGALGSRRRWPWSWPGGSHQSRH